MMYQTFQAKRAQSRTKILTDTERLEQLLLENLAKEKMVIQALGDPEKVLSPLKINRVKPAIAQESRDEIFKLPKLKELDDDSAETEECPKQSYDFNIHKVISILIYI